MRSDAAALRSAIRFCIVIAHSTAATIEGNSTRTPSPVVLTRRPPKERAIERIASRRSRTALAAPDSSSPINLE